MGFIKCLSVQVYRHCILQVRYRDFTEILLTFVMPINEYAEMSRLAGRGRG